MIARVDVTRYIEKLLAPTYYWRTPFGRVGLGVVCQGLRFGPSGAQYSSQPRSRIVLVRMVRMTPHSVILPFHPFQLRPDGHAVLHVAISCRTLVFLGHISPVNTASRIQRLTFEKILSKVCLDHSTASEQV